MEKNITGFEHLHLHTDFSLLDGYSMPEEAAERVFKNNQKFLCITDHGMMAAVPRQIKACEEYGISPIFGSELYVNDMHGVNTSDLSPEEKKEHRRSYHLLAIATTNKGYSNLVRLSSWAWANGFYYKPRVTHEQLLKYKEGVIFTSCCYMGEIGQAFDKGGSEAAYKTLDKYIEMFKGQFYIEIMLLDFVKQKPYNKWLVEAAENKKLPIILSNDCHYPSKEDSKHQQYMLMVRTKNTIADLQQAMANNEDMDKFFELQDTNLWIKSEEELNEKWEKDYKDIIPLEVFNEAKRNTVEICRKAKGVEFDRSLKLPKVPDENEEFREALIRGFKERGLSGKKYSLRLKEEYELICNKGFASYFLIQKKMVDEARRVCPKIMGWGGGDEATGCGRGCLSPETSIVLSNGSTKFIKDIQVGDMVITRNGESKPVEKIFVYDIDENLLNIKSFYGDVDGVTLTKDHKILCEKGIKLNGYTKKSKKWAEPSGNLQWIRADEVSVGDWVYVPKIKPLKNCEQVLDLLHYANQGSLTFGADKRISDSRKEYKNRKLSHCVNIPKTRDINGSSCYRKNVYRNTKGGILLQVRDIKEVEGIKKVYDIQVKEEHNYLTSSFLVHNSAVGSLACYCLGITEVDPVKHDLLFSRFLSEARGGNHIKTRFTQLPDELLED